MDVKEKLVKLIRNAHKKCKAKKTCHDCEQYGNGSDCVYLFMADDLIQNGVTVQEWISVKDRLPEPFVPVLVQMPGEQPFPTVREGFISKDGIWQSAMFRREPGEVTHWQPMPQPPKGD